MDINQEYVMDDFRIVKDDNFIVLKADLCSIQIGFDGSGLDSVATVVVPGRYGGLMSGLCGDCNGQLDDFKLRDGTDVSSMPDKFETISQSYCVDESYDNAAKDWSNK